MRLYVEHGWVCSYIIIATVGFGFNYCQKSSGFSCYRWFNYQEMFAGPFTSTHTLLGFVHRNHKIIYHLKPFRPIQPIAFKILYKEKPCLLILPIEIRIRCQNQWWYLHLLFVFTWEDNRLESLSMKKVKKFRAGSQILCRDIHVFS